MLQASKQVVTRTKSMVLRVQPVIKPIFPSAASLFLISYSIIDYFVSVTLVAALLMAVLFVSELNYYLTKEVHPSLFVDTSRGQKLRINIDITFAHLPCGCEYIIHFFYTDS